MQHGLPPTGLVQAASGHRLPATGLDAGPAPPGLADIAGLACLGGGTMVATLDGPLPVDWLRPGDQVLTRDNGYQPLLWLGQARLPRHPPPEARPLQLSAGALGPDLPAHPLVLGPAQPVLLAGPEPELWFAEAEMLAPARDLAGLVRPVHGRPTLYHLLFAAPEVILAEGLWLASVQATPDHLARLPDRLRATLGAQLAAAHATAARPVLRDWETAMILRQRLDPRQTRAA